MLEHHPRASTDHHPSTTRSQITLADRAGVLMARVSDRLRLPAARLTAHDAGDDVRLVDDCRRRVPALQRAGSADGTTCVESVCGAYSRDWNTCVCLLEDLKHLYAIQQIRSYYRSLVPDGLTFFADITIGDPRVAVTRAMGMSPSSLNLLFTAGGMIAAINSILAAIGIALILLGAGLVIAIGASCGAITALVLYGLHLRWVRFPLLLCQAA